MVLMEISQAQKGMTQAVKHLPPLSSKPQYHQKQVFKKPNASCFYSNAESRPKMILIMMIMGPKCKRGTERISEEGAAKERVMGLKRMKVCYLYLYEDSKMKPTKYCLQKREWGGGRNLREYSRGDEVAHITLYAHLWNHHNETPLDY
jgi:hypothetical protein